MHQSTIEVYLLINRGSIKQLIAIIDDITIVNENHYFSLIANILIKFK